MIYALLSTLTRSYTIGSLLEDTTHVIQSRISQTYRTDRTGRSLAAETDLSTSSITTRSTSYTAHSDLAPRSIEGPSAGGGGIVAILPL